MDGLCRSGWRRGAGLLVHHYTGVAKTIARRLPLLKDWKAGGCRVRPRSTASNRRPALSHDFHSTTAVIVHLTGSASSITAL
jgi:hypothetical protein